jgi:hypothetical protein
MRYLRVPRRNITAIRTFGSREDERIAIRAEGAERRSTLCAESWVLIASDGLEFNLRRQTSQP